LADLFGHRGIAHLILGRSAQAGSYQREAARLAERAGDPHGQGRALSNLADVLCGFDPRAALEPARASVDMGRRIGSRHLLGIAVTNLVDVLLLIGEWDEAAAVLRMSVDDGLDDLEYIEAFRGMLYALKGDVPAATVAVNRLIRMRSSE